MKRAAAFGLVTSLALVPTGADAAYKARSDANVQFTAMGPGGTAIVGTTHDPSVGEDSNGVLTITVPLANLTTGMSLRDKHMREKYLEVPKYATAVLVIPRSKLTLPADGQSTSGDASGQMTIHGQTRPASFHYTTKGTGKACAVSATLALNMNDYGIATPGYLGVTVKPQVSLTVSFTADDQ